MTVADCCQTIDDPEQERCFLSSLAAALSAADDDLVLVTGDRELTAAALGLGLSVAEMG